MNKISFKYCPICSKELDTGKIKFPAPNSILDLIEAEGKYYSDKTIDAKKFFKTHDRSFTVQTWGVNNPAGYCKECNRIFAEFEIMDI